MTGIQILEKNGGGVITCKCISNKHYAFQKGHLYEMEVWWTSKEVTFVKTGNGYRTHVLPSIYDFIKIFEIEGLNERFWPLTFLVEELNEEVK